MKFGFRSVMLCGVALTSMIAISAQAQDSRAELIRHLDADAGTLLAARARTVAALRAPAGADKRRVAVRAKLLRLIGGLPSRDNPLAAKVTGRSTGDGFTVENVLFDSLPGQHVTANLFLPANATGRVPAVILSPGHGPSGKLSNYGFAANLARNGIAALAYDIVDEGERLQYLDPVTGATRNGRVTGDHTAQTFPAILTGEHSARYFLNDAMRGVDYLVSRPEIDAARIGAFGCSGGGTITGYLAALDTRIQAAASACWVNDYAHLLASPGPQEGEQSIPGFLAEGLDLADWVELAAPKPYAVVSTTEDMFPWAGASAAVAELQRFWSLYGASDRLEWIHGPGPHGNIAPLGDRIIAFFRKALKVDGPAAAFAPQRPARPEDVLVTPTGQLATSIGSVTVSDLTRDRARGLKRPVLSAAVLAAAIRELAGVRAVPGKDVPHALVAEKPLDGLLGDRVTLDTPDGPLDLRYARAPGATRTLVLLQPGPVATVAKPGGRVQKLAAAGWNVLVVQARGTDGTEEIKSEIVGDQNLLSLRAMLVGRTLPGIRIDDTIRAIDWLASADPQAKPALLGTGIMGPVALQAALLDSRISQVTVEGSPLSWEAAVELPLARDLPANAIPGVLTRYDLPDVIAALGPQRARIFAPVDPLGVPLREAGFRALLGPGFAFAPYPELP